MTEVVTGKKVIAGVVVVEVVLFDEKDDVDAAWPEVVVGVDVDWAETRGKSDEESRRHDRSPNLKTRATMLEDIQPLAVRAAAGTGVDHTSTT